MPRFRRLRRDRGAVLWLVYHVLESKMANSLIGAVASLDPRLAVTTLVTFSLIMLWHKRRRITVALPNVGGDFLTRHVETVKRKYTFSG